MQRVQKCKIKKLTQVDGMMHSNWKQGSQKPRPDSTPNLVTVIYPGVLTNTLPLDGIEHDDAPPNVTQKSANAPQLIEEPTAQNCCSTNPP